MEPSAPTRYIRCANCGRYLRAMQEVTRGFCSEECAAHFRRCRTCGSYVPEDQVYADGFCSEACAATYTFEEKRRSTLVRELS
jgi:predicted nucleic acid-binding Zn ribbon protein